MLWESATVKIDKKLTAVYFVTSIRACPNSSASWGGGYTLATGTAELSETALTCKIVIITEYFEKYMHIINLLYANDG